MNRKYLSLLYFLFQAGLASVVVAFFVASPHSPVLAGSMVFIFFLAVHATVLLCQDKN